jgi:uncharacterized membrane protein
VAFNGDPAFALTPTVLTNSALPDTSICLFQILTSMRRFLDRLTPSVYQELLGADTKQKEPGMLSTKLVRFIRTIQVLAATLTFCCLQMHGQPLQRRWVDLARARAGDQAVAQASVAGPKSTGTYLTIDVPGARFLSLEGINPSGDIVGAYYDTSNVLQNVLLSNGTIHNINPPGGSTFGFLYLATQVGINPQGDIVGSYSDSSGIPHAFLLSKGAYTIIDAPNANSIFGTDAGGINPSGEIVGFYSDSSFCGHGFLLSQGKFRVIDVPPTLGAGAAPCTTQPVAINPQGDILGQYTDTSGNIHGFLLRNGNFSSFDILGAAQTAPLGMNPQGDIVGLYADSSLNTFGFLMSHGMVTIIDVPGSCAGCTFPYGINPKGDIAGSYIDASSNYHGFLLITSSQ